MQMKCQCCSEVYTSQEIACAAMVTEEFYALKCYVHSTQPMRTNSSLFNLLLPTPWTLNQAVSKTESVTRYTVAGSLSVNV